jgi:hypothetical protein
LVPFVDEGAYYKGDSSGTYRYTHNRSGSGKERLRCFWCHLSRLRSHQRGTEYPVGKYPHGIARCRRDKG